MVARSRLSQENGLLTLIFGYATSESAREGLSKLDLPRRRKLEYSGKWRREEHHHQSPHLCQLKIHRISCHIQTNGQQRSTYLAEPVAKRGYWLSSLTRHLHAHGDEDLGLDGPRLEAYYEAAFCRLSFGVVGAAGSPARSGQSPCGRSAIAVGNEKGEICEEFRADGGESETQVETLSSLTHSGRITIL